MMNPIGADINHETISQAEAINWLLGAGSIVLPLIIIAILALWVPRRLGPFFPETLMGLILNGLASALFVLMASMTYFWAAYALHSQTVMSLLGEIPFAAFLHFLKLGMLSAFVWGPLVVLSAANQHRHWKENVW